MDVDLEESVQSKAFFPSLGRRINPPPHVRVKTTPALERGHCLQMANKGGWGGGAQWPLDCGHGEGTEPCQWHAKSVRREQQH